MISFLKRLWSRIRPAPEPAPVVPSTHRHTLVLAYNYAQAREWARHNLPYHEDWRYISQTEHLLGCRNVRLVKLEGWDRNRSRDYLNVRVIKLDGWEHGRSRAYLAAVARLEKEGQW